MDVSKLSASFLSATSENSFSLANLKLDFSLVKVEAPAEYASLGPALTARRKENAEEGPIHRTARRLGLLFEQYIPQTPKLMTTFGLRCTEIMSTPGVNPQGSPSSHGPFSSYVGADGTALWAAATSGISSLGVYLLACLLADSWDATKATSIWVELVKCRKLEIETAAGSNRLVHESGMFAVKQDITRDELKSWDASARAWLASASQVKNKERVQLTLIIKNMAVPFTSKSSVYEDIISIWQQSMRGMEDLLHGRPQKITNRASLLAFPAWNIFPDLLILGDQTVSVPFCDPLVPKAGVCTLGTWEPNEKNSSLMSWSLALSHLQYYGNAVTVESEGSSLRVTLPQLYLVVLGALLGSWKVRAVAIYDVAQWFVDLWQSLQTSVGDIRLDGLPWLGLFVEASQNLVSNRSDEDKKNEKLVKFGMRRYVGLFPTSGYSNHPFFGLGSPGIYKILSETSRDEANLSLLRMQIQSPKSSYFIGWKTRALIASRRVMTFKHDDLEKNFNCNFIEYATAIPHTARSRKRNEHGEQLKRSSHARWLYVSRTRGDDEVFKQYVQPICISWKERVQSRGEVAFCQDLLDFDASLDIVEYFSRRPAWLFLNPSECCLEEHQPFCDCFNLVSTSYNKPYSFKTAVEAWPSSVYVCRHHNDSWYDPDIRHEIPLLYSKQLESRPKATIPESDIKIVRLELDTTLDYLENLESSITYPRFSSGLLFDYLCSVSDLEPYRTIPVCGISKLKKFFPIHSLAENRLPQEAASSLNTIVAISQLYRDVDEATISIDIIQNFTSKGLFSEFRAYHTEMFPSLAAYPQNGRSMIKDDPFIYAVKPSRFTHRGLIFACLAYFESGSIDLKPSSLSPVFAMASGNSIFVTEELLVDPYSSLSKKTIDVRRVIGNIGRSGISMLVSPQTPMVRKMGNDWNVVEHAPYDWNRENNFKGTSMHLSFTDWSVPVGTSDSRSIDWAVQFVEAVISVFDAGKWVADLNIDAINRKAVHFATAREGSECSHDEPKNSNGTGPDYTSIDNWEELLDPPSTIAIVRAKGNWVAKLAVLSVLHQTAPETKMLLCPPNYCLRCEEERFEEDKKRQLQVSRPSHGEHENNLQSWDSALPKICID